MFLQHLVDADAERLVVVTFVNEVLVDAELGRSDRLALRDPGEVESELPVMAAHWEEFLVVLH